MTTPPFPTPASAPVVPAGSPTEPCPICGRPLAPVVLGPETAPWLCAGCHRGWFAAELSAEARAGWVSGQRCFHWRLAARLRAAVDQEVAAARQRGTSVRPDQLRHLSVAERAVLAGRRGLDATFLAQVKSLDAGGV